MTYATTFVVGRRRPSPRCGSWSLTDRRRRESIPVGWLTFALIRPTIPAWTAAASCYSSRRG